MGEHPASGVSGLASRWWRENFAVHPQPRGPRDSLDAHRSHIGGEKAAAQLHATALLLPAPLDGQRHTTAPFALESSTGCHQRDAVANPQSADASPPICCEGCAQRSREEASTRRTRYTRTCGAQRKARKLLQWVAPHLTEEQQQALLQGASGQAQALAQGGAAASGGNCKGAVQESTPPVTVQRSRPTGLAPEAIPACGALLEGRSSKGRGEAQEGSRRPHCAERPPTWAPQGAAAPLTQPQPESQRLPLPQLPLSRFGGRVLSDRSAASSVGGSAADSPSDAAALRGVLAQLEAPRHVSAPLRSSEGEYLRVLSGLLAGSTPAAQSGAELPSGYCNAADLYLSRSSGAEALPGSHSGPGIGVNSGSAIGSGIAIGSDLGVGSSSGLAGLLAALLADPLEGVLPPPVPASLSLSSSSANEMGMARRPLGMREVRQLTVALSAAMVAGEVGAVGSLLSELKAAACPTGPAPQRLAHYFSCALSSRLRGDAKEQLQALTPATQPLLDSAVRRYTAVAPYWSYFRAAIVEPMMAGLQAAINRAGAGVGGHHQMAFDRAGAGSGGNPQAVINRAGGSCGGGPQAAFPGAAGGQGASLWASHPEEHIHIIEANVDLTGFVWSSFLSLLQQRPQGAPHSLRLSLLDLVPPALQGSSERNLARALWLKEQLALQAATVGVAGFCCEVVQVGTDDVAGMEQKLGQLLRKEPQGARLQQCHDAPRGRFVTPDVVQEEPGRGASGVDTATTGIGLPDSSEQQPPALKRKAGGFLPGAAAAASKLRGGEGQQRRSRRPRPVLQFVGVACCAKLHELAGVPGADGQSARSAFLTWLAALRPDVVAVSEFHNDTRPPFTPLLVDRALELNSVLLHANDLFCQSPAPARREAPQRNGPCSQDLVEGQGRVGPVPQALAPVQIAAKTTAEGGRSSHLPVAEEAGSPRLAWEDMLVAERYAWMRSVLSAVGLPDELRYVFPRWQHDWLALLRQHGFELSPVAAAVGRRMVEAGRSYQEFVRMVEIEGGAMMVVCGRPYYFTTVWTVAVE